VIMTPQFYQRQEKLADPPAGGSMLSRLSPLDNYENLIAIQRGRVYVKVRQYLMIEFNNLSRYAMPTLQKPIDSGFNAACTATDVIKGLDLSGRVAIVTGGYSGNE
jgi:hypothetical protein